jgi:hypothetical protein
LIPRVSDFGYSTIAASQDDSNTIILPRSTPWNAPEHGFHRVSYKTAKKMDIYSVALLCLWLIFHEEVSGSAILPVEATEANVVERSSWSWSDSIEAWKQADCVGRLLSMLMKRRNNVRDVLNDKFQSCLSDMTTLNPEMRESSLDRLLSVLGKG